MRWIAAVVSLMVVAPSLAGTLVVLNKSDDTASVINPVSGETLRVVEVGNAPHEATVAPDGVTVVVGDYGDAAPGNTLSVFRLDSDDERRVIDLGTYYRPHGIVFMPDGDRVLVTAEHNQALILVNIRSGEIEKTYATAARGSHMVARNDDATLAVTANIPDGSVSIIDLRTGERTGIVATGAGAEGIAVRAGTDEAWVTNRSADTVSVVDLRTREVLATLECGVFPIRATMTPDGSRVLVSCAESGDVAVFDTAKRELLARIPMKSTTVEEEERDRRLFGDRFGQSPVPIGVLIEPDGSRAYVANTNADVVTVIDLRTLEVTGRIATGRQPDGMAWSSRPAE